MRGRAANPRWLAGQMRHGHRGAAEIAQSLDNLYCFAALTDVVGSAQFDLMFDATLGDDGVRAFLLGANRQAASHMAGLFEEAARRGFWLSRRNSSARILASVVEERGMNAIAPRRKGWCPGALRPMETGDGLIARVRASRGRLSLDQAAALAESALGCGNGAIGLSARGNLHLRGLSERTLPELHARLADVRLIDANPEIERLRNIVSSPLDDVDPDAFDLGPSVAALETRLGRDAGSARVAGQVQLCVRCIGAPAARRR